MVHDVIPLLLGSSGSYLPTRESIDHWAPKVNKKKAYPTKNFDSVLMCCGRRVTCFAIKVMVLVGYG